MTTAEVAKYPLGRGDLFEYCKEELAKQSFKPQNCKPEIKSCSAFKSLTCYTLTDREIAVKILIANKLCPVELKWDQAKVGYVDLLLETNKFPGTLDHQYFVDRCNELVPDVAAHTDL